MRRELYTKFAACLRRSQQARREQVFQALLQDILELWNELGISPSSSNGLTSSYGEATTAQSSLDLAILQTTQLLTRENSAGTQTHSLEGLSSVLKPDSETLSRLSHRKAALEAEREERMQRIQDLYDQLYALWSRLGVSDEEADEFVEVWKGCEPRCIQAVSLLLSLVQVLF